MIYRRYSRISRVKNEVTGNTRDFNCALVINSSTSVNGKLRNRWNISILSSRFVQFPPLHHSWEEFTRRAYTPGQVLLTPVQHRNKNPYGVIGIMLLSPCDGGGGGEFRTNCIVRGGITIARGGITSFNFVFRIFSNLLATFSFFFFFFTEKNTCTYTFV